MLMTSIKQNLCWGTTPFNNLDSVLENSNFIDSILIRVGVIQPRSPFLNIIRDDNYFIF